MKKRINIKTIGALLIALLLIFTFLSKTVYQYSLPAVNAGSPVKGKLHKIETVKGIAGWSVKGELYAGATGSIAEIMIEKGETVSKGQPLMRLSFSDEEVTSSIEKEYDLQQVNTEIKAAEEDCTKLKTLYEAGAISKSEYETEERSRNALYLKREKLLRDLSDAKNEAALIVSAPEDGVVTDLLVQKGQRVNLGEKVGNYGTASEFGIECAIPLENDFIKKGDVCKVGNSSVEFRATVVNVSAEADKKRFVFKFLMGTGNIQISMMGRSLKRNAIWERLLREMRSRMETPLMLYLRKRVQSRGFWFQTEPLTEMKADIFYIR